MTTLPGAVRSAVPQRWLAGVTGPFREIGDLKRVRVAHADGSAAERAFVRSWVALVAGADPGRVAASECAVALAGARLAGVDAAVLRDCGLSAEETTAVLRRAVQEVAGGLHPATVDRVHAAVPELAAHADTSSALRSHNALPDPENPHVGSEVRFTGPEILHSGSQVRSGTSESPDCGSDVRGVPGFVGALCRQPRAGATAPGQPRLVVEPPENHAEHCWAVAVYGALLADPFGADPGDAFLLGLAHHLHNAVLPDAGFAGEMLLGGHLAPVIDRLTERELATLPPALSERIRGLLACRADADTAAGRAFHAADVLDRVLQCHHHARAAGFTADQALVDLELVHAGPVADYHHAVLAAADL